MEKFCNKKKKNKLFLSPDFFKKNIIQQCRLKSTRILLPEGENVKIIKSASICSKLKIANCILLGSSKKILEICKKKKINLGKEIEIIDPKLLISTDSFFSYSIKKKEESCKKNIKQELNDVITIGMLMLKRKLADGLVAGLVHTTAKTVLPAIKIIKVKNNCSIISSLFFMLFPKKVIIYGDCAINPNPKYFELAEIAIQAAEFAEKMGIHPRIAMLSYATGKSAHGKIVEKVKKATSLVKKQMPNLIIDGPLQYDAASVPEISLMKSPNSSVSGNANIFIFPDLNSGNITYKAVQRTNAIQSFGPILQGIKIPVNDLSRGASIEEIVFTIALTSLQV